MRGSLMITGDAAADELLNTDGTALLIGMLLDQQVPMEMAFHGPATLLGRLGHLDASTIAAMGEDEAVAVCCEKPAIHRFPAAMGRRIHALCSMLTTEYGGRGENVWEGVASGDELYQRLRSLPGLRRREVTHLCRRAGEADGRTARRLVPDCGQVRRRHAAQRRRLDVPGIPCCRAPVEARPEGGQPRQAGPPAVAVLAASPAPVLNGVATASPSTPSRRCNETSSMWMLRASTQTGR